VMIYPNGDYSFQSRNRVLTIVNDNYAFAKFAEKNIETFKSFDAELRKDSKLKNKILVYYGEWAGAGIQKGVGISNLEKFFILFSVKSKDEDKKGIYLKREKWEKLKDENNRIFNINDIEHQDIEIDFNKPEEAVNKMVEYVNNIEKDCPVSSYIHTHDKIEKPSENIGEGMVFVGFLNDERYTFKVKGKKHSNSKVASLTVADIAKIDSARKFSEIHATENRFMQGIEVCFTSNNITEYSKKDIGTFINWVASDIIEEEKLTLVNSDLDIKKVKSYISTIAAKWFIRFIEEN